jgi:hypothetical protein
LARQITGPPRIRLIPQFTHNQNQKKYHDHSNYLLCRRLRRNRCRRPDGSLSPLKIGAIFKEIPSGAWAAIAVLFVASIVVTIIFPPFK